MKKKYLCHVDFFGLYNLFQKNFKQRNLKEVFTEILSELGIEIIYLAAFNYDFLQIGKTKYGAVSQLNEITRIMQRKKDFRHTFDPVFSFCTNDKEYVFQINHNFESFGKESVYTYALKNKMEYLHLGTSQDFISTGIHFAEKFFDVKYRYKKQFIGKYKFKNKNELVTYNHTVWPMTKKLCSYDAKKINRDLLKDGVWKVIKSSNGFYVKKANINDFNEYIKEKVDKDPFYPVHKKTKQWMIEYLKSKKSISLEYFEK